MMKRGFTLIELLVVIAIIAILAAMLLPALQQARAKSQSTKCVSNMKQSAQLVHMYTNDFRGMFMWYNSDPVYSGWANLLKKLNYVSSVRGLKCPSGKTYSEENHNSVFGFNYTSPSRSVTTSSFPTSAAVWKSTPASGAIKLDRTEVRPSLPMLSETAYIAGGTFGNMQYYYLDIATGYNWTFAYPWHRSRINVASVDGHVESAQPRRLADLFFSSLPDVTSVAILNEFFTRCYYGR